MEGFCKYAKDIGLMSRRDVLNFQVPPEVIDPVDKISYQLFMFMLRLSRDSLMELSKRVVEKWSNRKCVNKSQLSSSSAKKSKSLHRSTSNASVDRSTDRCDALYQMSHRKQELQLQKENLKQQKELEDCTFHPKLSTSSVKVNLATPVYDRLSKQAKNQQHRTSINKLMKEKHELAECSFKPQINGFATARAQSHHESSNTFNRLYNDADIQRKKIQAVIQLKEQSEQTEHPYQPNVLPPPKGLQEGYLSVRVGDRLYNEFFNHQQTLFQKMIVQNDQELQGCTFSPRINSVSKERQKSNNQSIHERLYSQGLLREQKNLSRQLNSEEKQQPTINQQSLKILDSKRSRPHIESLHSYVDKFAHPTKFYERLFQENENKERRLKQLSHSQMKEAGITFKPDIRKTDKSRKSHKKNNYSSTVSSGILCDKQETTVQDHTHQLADMESSRSSKARR